MAEYWSYGVNNDMDKKTKKRFDQLSDDDKDALETEFRAREDKGTQLSTKEIEDYINIKEHRGKLDYAHDMWNKEKWYGQKTQPDIAKEFYDTEVKKHTDYINKYKKAHPKSKFIQEAKIPERLSNEEYLKQADKQSLMASTGVMTDAVFSDDVVDQDQLDLREQMLDYLKQDTPEVDYDKYRRGQIAKGTIEFDPNAITRAGMLPSFDDLRTGWQNLTRTGDENLAGFDITSTMDVDTKPSYSDSAFLGFERGNQELTSADTFEGINTLARGPHDWDYSPEFYDAQRRQDLANLYAQNVDQGTTGGIKAGWRPNWNFLRTAASFVNPFDDKRPIGAALSYGMSKFKPTDTSLAMKAVTGGRDEGFGVGLSGKPSWAGIAHDKKHGTGAYKQKNIDDYVTKYKDVDYTTQKMKDKYADMYAQSTQGKKAIAASVAAAKAATGATTAAQHWGDISRGGGHQAPSIRTAPAGVTTSSGMHGGKHYYQGGRVGFSKGGIVDLWQELSNL